MKLKDKKSLLSKYSELREALIRTLEKSDYEIDVDGDDIDQLQGRNLLTVQNSVTKNNIIKLRAIDSALKMISDGTYGNCEDCGEPISIRRLEAIPGITTCVICAELSESRR